MTTKEKILNLLKKESNLTAFEIATKTGLVMKSVSTEANVLVKAGLLSKVKDGKGVRFSKIEIVPELPKTVKEEKKESKLPHEITTNDLDEIKEKIIAKRETKKATTKKNPFEDKSTVKLNSGKFRQVKKNKNWKDRSITEESYLGVKVGDKVKLSDKCGGKYTTKGIVKELFICEMGYARLLVEVKEGITTFVSTRRLTK